MVIVSLASVVITSIMFAFVQYSETASKDRVDETKKRLSDANVYGADKAGRLNPEMQQHLRRRYDTLINHRTPRMKILKGVLYGLLTLLALTHAANAQGPLVEEQHQQALEELIPKLVAVSWWLVVTMVAVAGGRMLMAAVQVTQFVRKVDELLIWLDGVRSARSDL